MAPYWHNSHLHMSSDPKFIWKGAIHTLHVGVLTHLLQQLFLAVILFLLFCPTSPWLVSQNAAMLSCCEAPEMFFAD